MRLFPSHHSLLTCVICTFKIEEKVFWACRKKESVKKSVNDQKLVRKGDVRSLTPNTNSAEKILTIEKP
jgi:hypothetical protein